MLVLLILAVAFCADYVITPELIERINSNPRSTWKAGMNSVFAGKTFFDVKDMMGTILVGDEIPKTRSALNADLPKDFDTYKKWPTCKHPIRNQKKCGSCWAFSAAEVLSDRFCIASKAQQNLILSAQDLVSCESDENACQGGYLSREWEYLEGTGIVDDDCFPYVSGTGIVPKCPYKCKNGQPWKKHKVQSGSTKHFEDAESAMQDMFAHGSIQGGFTVYQDFYSYKSGVYSHQWGMAVGGHAIKIQGWGVEKSWEGDVKYWLVANSWGSNWGVDGYFKIKRGSDDCGIEDQLYAGLALTDE